MDLRETIKPKSDQLNYEDFLGGPMTVTVKDVRAGSAEQPVFIDTVEFPGRPYKPSKSMRRVIVASWGPNSDEYVGRQITLYGDPSVTWAGEEVGGIRISHLSHIERPVSVKLTVRRGKRQPYEVKPLPTKAAPQVTAEQVAACTDVNQLRSMWQHATPDMRALIEQRRNELTENNE